MQPLDTLHSARRVPCHAMPCLLLFVMNLWHQAVQSEHVLANLGAGLPVAFRACGGGTLPHGTTGGGETRSDNKDALTKGVESAGNRCARACVTLKIAPA